MSGPKFSALQPVCSDDQLIYALDECRSISMTTSRVRLACILSFFAKDRVIDNSMVSYHCLRVAELPYVWQVKAPKAMACQQKPRRTCERRTTKILVVNLAYVPISLSKIVNGNGHIRLEGREIMNVRDSFHPVRIYKCFNNHITLVDKTPANTRQMSCVSLSSHHTHAPRISIITRKSNQKYAMFHLLCADDNIYDPNHRTW